MALALGSSFGVAPLRCKFGVCGRQCRDDLAARRGVGRGGDVGVAGREELLFLEFHAFPRWVAERGAKAAGPAGGRVGGSLGNIEDVGELQVPVEEPVLLGCLLDQVVERTTESGGTVEAGHIESEELAAFVQAIQYGLGDE